MMKKDNEKFSRREKNIQLKNEACISPSCAVDKRTMGVQDRSANVHNNKESTKLKNSKCTKQIICIIIMLLGLVGVIFSLMEAYFMAHYEYYAKYIFINKEINVYVLIISFWFFVFGILILPED